MIRQKEINVWFIIAIFSIVFLLLGSSGCIFSPSDRDDDKDGNNDALLINGGQSWTYNALINSPEKFSCSLLSGEISHGEFQWDFGDGTKNETIRGDTIHIYSNPGIKLL